ncbi:MAG: hypothetical protein ACPGUD_03300 [Parashewanella sp.]
MDIFQDLKSVMSDIQKRKSAITSQLREFQGLQAEIRTLAQRAKTDASAREKLVRLQKAFPQGFQKQQDQVLDKVSELGQNFKKLEVEFADIGHVPNAQKTIATKSGDEPLEEQEITKGSIKESEKPKNKKKKVHSYL